MKKTTKDALITGFAVFAIFFGAGNLIFPGAVGLMAGDRWPVAMIATLLCGVFLPLLALLAVAKMGNGWSDMAKPVGTWFDKGLFFICTLGMVVLSNLPRTAATTHEVAMRPIFPNLPIWVTVVIFFAIVFFLSFDEKGLIEKVGKYLTPIMLVLLVIIVIKGLITPIGTPITTEEPKVFGNAFTELYYTGDLFSGLFISSIFLADVARRGYKGSKERKGMTIRAIVIAGIAFTVVYGGLLIFGAQMSEYTPQGTDRTALLSDMVHRILGNFGTIALSLSVALACLSTATGLIGIASNFLAGLTKNKIPYRVWIIALCVMGTVMASLGVEKIISVAAPVFMLTYPMGLTITLLGLLYQFVPNDGAFRGAVIGAGVSGVLSALSVLGVGFAGNILSKIPLSSIGFEWVLFAIVGFFVGWAIWGRDGKKTAPVETAPEEA